MKVCRFTAVGHGYFPVDMLRYDRCWPATQDAIHNMPVETYRRHSLEPAEVEMCGINNPTAERWQSFGWQIKDVRKDNI